MLAVRGRSHCFLASMKNYLYGPHSLNRVHFSHWECCQVSVCLWSYFSSLFYHSVYWSCALTTACNRMNIPSQICLNLNLQILAYTLMPRVLQRLLRPSIWVFAWPKRTLRALPHFSSHLSSIWSFLQFQVQHCYFMPLGFWTNSADFYVKSWLALFPFPPIVTCVAFLFSSYYTVLQ